MKRLESLATIFENLARAPNCIRAADAIPADRWKTRPADECWSAGELVGHLITIERAIIGRTDSFGKTAEKSAIFQAIPSPDGGCRITEWFQLIASRQIRHTKQMREIAVSLPKTVTSLDK